MANNSASRQILTVTSIVRIGHDEKKHGLKKDEGTNVVQTGVFFDAKTDGAIVMEKEQRQRLPPQHALPPRVYQHVRPVHLSFVSRIHTRI